MCAHFQQKLPLHNRSPLHSPLCKIPRWSSDSNHRNVHLSTLIHPRESYSPFRLRIHSSSSSLFSLAAVNGGNPRRRFNGGSRLQLRQSIHRRRFLSQQDPRHPIGRQKVAIMVGGGNIFRAASWAGCSGLDRSSADYIGCCRS